MEICALARILFRIRRIYLPIYARFDVQVGTPERWCDIPCDEQNVISSDTAQETPLNRVAGRTHSSLYTTLLLPDQLLTNRPVGKVSLEHQQSGFGYSSCSGVRFSQVATTPVFRLLLHTILQT